MKRLSIPRLPLIAGAVGLIIAIALAWRFLFGEGASSEELVLYEMTPTDLAIVITERGNLESQVQTDIRCEVENLSSSRSGQNGTTIIYIIPNGSQVSEGDLLVELDSSPIREMLNEQTISFERTKAEQIQAQAKYDNQVTQNVTSIANADLEVRLAELELEMFVDDENGTHKLNVDEIKRGIDEVNNRILEAQSVLELRRNEKEGVEALFELGYKGQSDLDSSRLSFLQAESSLASALNQLDTQQAALSRMEAYEEPMSRLQLEGALANANRSREQVEVDNLSQLTQAQAALDAANRALEQEEERLNKLETQVANCMIYAPHDGMAVWAQSRDYRIEEGAVVRERQRIISLPDLSLMQVRTYVHESVLDQVQPGQRVSVTVDAFADERFDATVESVAVVPANRGWGSDVKTYETVITLDGAVENLKPGMTAVVDIHVDRMTNILAVPVQAIVQRDRNDWCYVASGSNVELREVELGATNDKFVHLVEGISDGEQVVLNPMMLFENDESDSFGGESYDADMFERKESDDDNEEVTDRSERSSRSPGRQASARGVTNRGQ